jgi:hypothetical protein
MLAVTAAEIQFHMKTFKNSEASVHYNEHDITVMSQRVLPRL